MMSTKMRSIRTRGFFLSLFALSNILSATSAQARNALHLATKTIEHPNPLKSNHSKKKPSPQSYGGDVFVSAEPTVSESLDGALFSVTDMAILYI